MLWAMRTALSELHYLEGYLGTIFDARRPTWRPRPCRVVLYDRALPLVPLSVRLPERQPIL